MWISRKKYEIMHEAGISFILEKERTIKKINKVEIMLYRMYPNDIGKITSLFQRYELLE